MSRPRLLALGNSHLRGVRAAFEAEPDKWAEIDIAWLAVAGASVDANAFRGGCIRPRAWTPLPGRNQPSDPQAEISLDHYDAIAVVGLDFKPLNAIALFRAAAWPDLPSTAANADLATAKETLISHAMARAALVASLSASPAGRIVRTLREDMDCPILLVPCPRLNQRAKWTDVPRFHGHGRAIRDGASAVIGALWEDAARQSAKSIGAQYIPQPKETIASHILTRRKFMVDRETALPTPDGPRFRPDMTHANANYGALVLRRLIRRTTAAAA